MSQEPRAAFAGQIAEVPVVELLQTIMLGGHTGIARFETPVGAATLWFRDGALVDADMGRHHMEGAVSRLLALESGTFEVEFKPITRRQVIKASTAEMIASAPPRPGVPAPVTGDDTDVGRKRARRAGISWHPTGGGKGRADVSGTVPAVRPEPSGSGIPAVLPSAPSGPMAVAPSAGTVPAPPGPGRTLIVAPSMPEATPHTVIAPAPSGPIATPTPVLGAPAPVITTTGATVPAPARVPTPAPIVAAPRVPTPVPLAAAPSPNAVVTPVPSPSTGPRHTAFGVPVMPPPNVEPHTPVPATPLGDDDRTLMRAGPIPPPAPLFVPPPLPQTAPAATPLQLEPQPAQWSTLTLPAAGGPPPAAAPAAAVEPSPVAVESGHAASARGEFQPLPPGWSPPQSTVREADKVVVSPEVVASQTMTAGSVPRATAATSPRPGGARRVEHRAAAVASAIGMAPPPAHERRHVADGVKLDQQVEAARAAGLTGASAPAVVGRYEVLLRIARGGMGTVYLARITGEGGFRRLFALKVVRDHLSQNDEYVRMLLQEARIASRLHHPNVVGIVDIGTLANQHYLVMDYVEGCTFSELLKVHRRTRPPHLVVPIMLDALTGLHAAHSLVDDDGSPLTLVHCDFSPQNMLVGTNGICRITDFGIAKAANAINERSSITRGKPAYVSPEQVVGRPVDHRSDVFSAGVVLWNALTGEQLFGGETPEQTLHAVLQQPIAPPSTVGLRPPSCFDRVCLRALERDPNRRYQSAEQMLIELRRIAIAEDFLAPSSDVGRWVADTFGRQLELRRQAAGISRGHGPDSQPMAVAVSVPELGLGDAELTSETRTLPADYGQTPVESPASKTAMIRSDVVAAVPPPVAAPTVEPPAYGKAILVALAVSCVTIAIAIAILRPEWIQGGAVDPYGRFSDRPAGDTDGAAAVEPATKKAPKPKARAIDGADAPGEVDAGKLAEPAVPAPAAPVDPATLPPTEAKATDAPTPAPKPAEAPAKPKKPKKPKKPPAESADTADAPPPPDPAEVLDPPPG